MNFNYKDFVLAGAGSDLLIAVASYLWEISFRFRGDRIHNLAFCRRCHAFVDRNRIYRGYHDKSEVMLFNELDKRYGLESAAAVRRMLRKVSSHTSNHKDGLMAIPSVNPIADYRYCSILSLRP